ncbi:histidine kinase [Flavobacteriaceae bacterium KMM 6897]|nr:histidine kinase [Flavobacteriaceae bacterium KMM 6897]
MNRTKRFLFQILLWGTVWLMAWLLMTEDMLFLQRHAPTFIVQVMVVGVLIYYMAPALLFNKKYVLFMSVSLALIVFCAAIISFSFMGPPGGPPPDLESLPPGMQPKAPPQFLIHFLFLSIAHVLATFLETFLFAQKKEEETIRNKNENLHTELKLLKSQINPHFLFNSLNNIYALSAIDAGKTQKSISYLSDMLRYVLYECEQDMVPLEKEVTYIENYIKLFSLKSSEKYPITIDFKIAEHNLQIAPMLFIPFMENALKHGNIDRRTDAYMRIKLEADTDCIHFEIENSKAVKPNITDDVGGIGIENVKKRLAILYPKRHELLINETTLAFKVDLKLDLNGND